MRDPFDLLAGWLQEHLVIPMLYQVGLMNWEDVSSNYVLFALYGAAQVAVTFAVWGCEEESGIPSAHPLDTPTPRHVADNRPSTCAFCANCWNYWTILSLIYWFTFMGTHAFTFVSGATAANLGAAAPHENVNACVPMNVNH